MLNLFEIKFIIILSEKDSKLHKYSICFSIDAQNKYY